MEKIKLSKEQRSKLLKVTRSFNSSRSDTLRMKVILLVEKGLNNSEIARKLGVNRHFVRKWKKKCDVRECEETS